jgi:hypothetical protein
MAGKVDVISSGPTPTIIIDGGAATISVGGNGLAGEIVIRDTVGNSIVHLRSGVGQLSIQRPTGQPIVEIGEDITVYDSSGNPILGVINESTTLYVNGDLLLIDSSTGGEYLKIGPADKGIELRNPNDQSVLKITSKGEVFAGGNGTNGRFTLFDDSGHIRMTVEDAGLSLQNPMGHKTTVIEGGQLYLGGGSGGGAVDGTLNLIDKTGKVRVRMGGAGQELTVASADLSARVEVQGERIGVATQQGQVAEINKSGDMTLGGAGEAGSLSLRDNNGKGRVSVTAEPNIALRNPLGTKILELRHNGDIRAGGGGQDGDLILMDQDGKEAIRAGGSEHNIVINNAEGKTSVELGRKGLHINDSGHIRVRDHGGKELIHIDGISGDIILANADCAEDFDFICADAVQPGTVVAMGEDGRLRPCTHAYDKKVAGVVSGASACKPGLVLDRKEDRPDRLPVALMGKVYCKVDARYAPIEVGDMLTTSPTPGHAMKANDSAWAFGAVIGKALRPQGDGLGLVPILVSLQ